MNDGYIRNREGKIVGRYDGSTIRDGIGRIVAKLDGDGYTRNRSGRIIGRGDQRLRALGESEHNT